jgi:hypothetical protein
MLKVPRSSNWTGVVVDPCSRTFGGDSVADLVARLRVVRESLGLNWRLM